MRLAQEALNKARLQLADRGNGYTPPAVHAKPSMAVSSALCPPATDASGACLGFAPLRCVLSRRLVHVLCVSGWMVARRSPFWVMKNFDGFRPLPPAGAPSAGATSAASTACRRRQKRRIREPTLCS